jgi:hypothetical protein
MVFAAWEMLLMYWERSIFLGTPRAPGSVTRAAGDWGVGAYT